MGAGGDAVIIMMEYLSHETQTWVQFKNFKDTSHKVIAQSLHLSSGEAAWNKYKHGPASQAASVLTVLLLQRKTRRCDCVFPLVCMGVYDRYRTESERQMWMRDATQCACVCVCACTEKEKPKEIMKKCSGSWKRHWIKSVWTEISDSLSLAALPFALSDGHHAWITRQTASIWSVSW